MAEEPPFSESVPRPVSFRLDLRLLLGLFALNAWLSAMGQVPRDYAVDLKVVPSTSVPRISLTWSQRQQAAITGQQVYRRLKGEVNWNLLATLSNTDTSFADTTALEGIEYEYWMKRTYTGFSVANPLGYINAGVNLPMVEDRGKLLLLVDETIFEPLTLEITQLQQDLTADGWTVQILTASRTDTAVNIKALISTVCSMIQGSTQNIIGIDGYYHIKVALLMREQGWRLLAPLDFPWLQLTILGPGRYTDHHFLFHVLQAPFTLADPRIGAKMAAVLFAVVGLYTTYVFLARFGVRYPFLWIAGLLACAPIFLWRQSMARTQSLSLLLIVLGLWALFAGKPRLLVLVGFAAAWLFNGFFFVVGHRSHPC